MSRTFRQWDVVLVPYPHPEQPHYLVVISPDWVAGNPDFRTLNGLICHTIRPPGSSAPRARGFPGYG